MSPPWYSSRQTMAHGKFYISCRISASGLGAGDFLCYNGNQISTPFPEVLPMTPVKSTAPQPDKMLRGFAAVACAAALLAAAVLLVVSGGQNTPQPPVETPP